MKSEYLERVDLLQSHSGVYKEHLSLYDFAKQFVLKKKVLDLGCGTGYGTFFLSNVVENIVGIDISVDAINRARENFKSQNLIYKVMDTHQLEFDNKLFDAIISFEVFEHLKDQNKVLEEVKRVLKSDGIFILSTPNKIYSKGKNPYHIKEFFKNELEIILTTYFKKVELYGQSKSGKIREIYKGNKFKNIMAKVDFLKLRNILLKGKIRKTIYNLFGFNVEEDIKISDFIISKDDVEKANTLIGVCKK